MDYFVLKVDALISLLTLTVLGGCIRNITHFFCFDYTGQNAKTSKPAELDGRRGILVSYSFINGLGWSWYNKKEMAIYCF